MNQKITLLLIAVSMWIVCADVACGDTCSPPGPSPGPSLEPSFCEPGVQPTCDYVGELIFRNPTSAVGPTDTYCGAGAPFAVSYSIVGANAAYEDRYFPDECSVMESDGFACGGRGRAYQEPGCCVGVAMVFMCCRARPRLPHRASAGSAITT